MLSRYFDCRFVDNVFSIFAEGNAVIVVLSGVFDAVYVDALSTLFINLVINTFLPLYGVDATTDTVCGTREVVVSSSLVNVPFTVEPASSSVDRPNELESTTCGAPITMFVL